MKLEIEFSDIEIREQMREVVEKAVHFFFLDDCGRTTRQGNALLEQVSDEIRIRVMKGELRQFVLDAISANLANVVNELTTVEMRRLIRAELKSMREQGELQARLKVDGCE